MSGLGRMVDVLPRGVVGALYHARVIDNLRQMDPQCEARRYGTYEACFQQICSMQRA